MTVVLMFTAKQDNYQTVAEALQAAVVSLLADKELGYEKSFYYWAAFITHGFASVQLENALLDQVHDRLETLKQRVDDGGNDDHKTTLAMAILTLTREAYHQHDERQGSMSLL